MATRRAKITAYNYTSSNGGCGDFSLSAYWGGGYKNVFYLNGDVGRSTFENIIETVSDRTGLSKRTQDTSIEVFPLSVIAYTPLLAFLNTIGKHDVKEIEFLDTGDVYTIRNITVDDQGSELQTNQLVTITFQDEAISKINSTTTVLNSQKLAYWDNDDDGSEDLNGESEFLASTTEVFNTWQLYFESDGVTPSVSGDVLMSVYAVTQSGIESLVGLFQGEFTDLFSDSTKWQSSQQIWDYFNVADSVGHTNRVEFDKRAFAEDNGYFSDELEDRAVDIRFNLSIDGSTPQPTTLALVYSILGAFSSSGVQDAITGVYGTTTIGKVDQKNTLSTVQDVRTPLAGGASTLVTSAVLNTVTNYSNEYTLAIAPAAEHSYEGAFTTPSGYIGQNFRGAYGSDNFTLSINPLNPITQSLNILNFTVGTSPYIFSFDWKYDRQTGGGGFPALGDIPLAGDAECLLDGVLVNNLPTIAPATLQVLGTQAITLPDADIHTVKIYLPTSTGYEIYTDFETQLKALF